jgi:hypothetical protein
MQEREGKRKRDHGIRQSKKGNIKLKIEENEARQLNREKELKN